MNRYPLLLTLTVCLLPMVPTSNIRAEDAFVQVRATKLRDQPKLWGKGIQDLSYGDRVNVVSSQEGWSEVRTPKGQKGFLHESALSAKKIVFVGKGGVSTADADDVVLAGKGFSREVENSLKAQNPSMNFHSVDEMEKVRVSADELRQFIAAGKLKG